MPKTLHTSIPNLKRPKMLNNLPKLKSSSHTVDYYKSCGHNCSTTIKAQIESLRMMDLPHNHCGSHHFFVTTDDDDKFAVVMYSSDPYVDFSRSMVEMVGSRLEQDLTVDWGYMQDLLVCYLEMNEKRSHKYILHAFVDVVEGLRQVSGERAMTTCKISFARDRRRKRRGVV